VRTVLGTRIIWLAVVATALLFAVSANAAGRLHQRFFFSPSRNISCELDQGGAIGSQAYCQTLTPPQNATLYPDGRVVACYGAMPSDCLGNAPEGTPVLGYGHSLSLGPFRCTSLKAGARCVVAKSGHGFLISRSGISHF
jgi:hypothetical protein